MSTLGWVVVIVLAAALGFGLGLLRSRSSGKVAEMQRERDTAREELGNYRREVDAHFERTAELFDKVTDDYRNLYDHLAVSARQLGAIPGESSEAPLARPEQRRLATEEAITGTEPSPADAAEDEGTEARPAVGEAGPDEAGPDEAGPDEAAPGEPRPDEARPEQRKPGEHDEAAPEREAETGPSEDHEKADDKDKRP